MPVYKAARVRQDGEDIILVPLDPSFGLRTRDSQQQLIGELQLQAEAENLPGTVIPVWNSGGHNLAWVAPKRLHAFLRTLGIHWVRARTNHQFYW